MPFVTKSSSSSTTSTCSSSSTASTSSLRVFLNQMLDSILHPFSPLSPQPDPSRSQDLLNVQHDMNANLSLFEKTYVSFPELVDQDGTNVRHSTSTTTTTQPQLSIAY